MAYMELYIAPVPEENLAEYFDLARKMAPIWRELGAVGVTELRPEDVPMGTLTSFPQAVQLQEGEVVAAGFIRFRDKAHRDQVMAAAMEDERMGAMFQQMPLDGKRMFFGGFAVEIEA